MHIDKAQHILEERGRDVETHILTGQVIDQLELFQKDYNIQLKVMGAYGHSRIREFFLGSNTNKMIGSSPVPLLLLR